MNIKTFSIVNSIAKVLTLMVSALLIIGIAITGFYPGIIVILIASLIPAASGIYVKKVSGRSGVLQNDRYIFLTILNILVIMLVIYMTFVILVDRIFPVIL